MFPAGVLKLTIKERKGNGTMTEITKVQLETLRKAHDAARGTNEYWKLEMEHSFRKDNGTWYFLGWGIPMKDLPAVLKVIKGKKYIYQSDERFTVSEAVAKLMNI